MGIWRGNVPLSIITILILAFVALLYTERLGSLSSRTIFRIKPCARKNTGKKSVFISRMLRSLHPSTVPLMSDHNLLCEFVGLQMTTLWISMALIMQLMICSTLIRINAVWTTENGCTIARLSLCIRTDRVDFWTGRLLVWRMDGRIRIIGTGSGSLMTAVYRGKLVTVVI